MSAYYHTLQENLGQLEQIRKIKKHIQQLQLRWQQETEALKALEKALDKEQRDVERLEREGLTSMLYAWTGDREQRLEKERAEYARVALRYNELYKSIQLIEYELDLLTKKEDQEATLQKQVEALIEMHEKALLSMDTPTGKMLQSIHSQLGLLQKFQIEINEAYEAGKTSFALIRRTEIILLEAQRWGQRDMWGGRGMGGSGHLKHTAIDQAQKIAMEARHSLIRFQNELRDVFPSLKIPITIDIESLGRFGDIFFDNVISDWLAQQKINKSLAGVSATRQHIEQAMDHLQQEKDQADAKAAELNAERRKIVIEKEK